MIAFLPIAGGHIKLAERFVSPAFSFAMGWNYWYNWTITGSSHPLHLLDVNPPVILLAPSKYCLFHLSSHMASHPLSRTVCSCHYYRLLASKCR